PHLPLGAPAAERRPRGVGSPAARARDPAAARRAGGGVPSLPAPHRAPALARRLLHVAPALDLRHGAAPPAFAPPSRAPHVPRRGHLRLVARRARERLGRREGRLPLRRLRARLAARPAARVDPARDLSLLHPRAAHLGARAARRPADRRRDDGGRGGDRVLRSLRGLSAPLPRRRAGGRPGQAERDETCSSRSAGRPARSSRLPSVSALISAPSRSALAASPSPGSMLT